MDDTEIADPSTTGVRAATRLEHLAIVRQVGSRMREAREMNNMAQQDAAPLLGYATPSPLAKIESGRTNAIRFDVLLKASLLFEVSLDYLFGLTADFETSYRAEQERFVGGWLFGLWEAQRKRDTQRDADTLRKLHNRLESMRNTIDDMLRNAASLEDAMATFTSLNPQFEHMPGGATLVAVTDRISAAARSGRAALDRFRAECVRAVDTNRAAVVA